MSNSAMDWKSPQVIDCLHTLWARGDSTRDIGLILTEKYGVEVNKNMVVSQAHKHHAADPLHWVARGSPIRPRAAGAPQPPVKLPPPTLPPPSSALSTGEPPLGTLPPLPCMAAVFVDRSPPPQFPAVRPVSAPRAAPTQARRLCDSLSSVLPEPRLRRADNSGCLRIIGDPKGTFRVCDAVLYNLHQPYCRQCHDECVTTARRLEESEPIGRSADRA